MYKCLMEDCTFVGGEPTNSKWNEMPNKKIKSLEYNYLDQKIELEGFDSYNHLYEITTGVIKVKGLMLTKVAIMARKDNQVHVFIFDLLNKKLNKLCKEFGKEWGDKPSTGWKEGLTGNIKITINNQEEI